MRLVKIAAMALTTFAMPLSAQSSSAIDQKSALTVQDSTSTAPSDHGASLTAENVDDWLDGFLPYALDSGDIAGAVVVVVKDGQVLTQRGFGYADMATRRTIDPERTLFRPGSTSKLLTWTAVMQLVQAGKLDLDRDVNDYLDFKIPPAFGKPITLRALMTHTAGFEEAGKYLIIEHPTELSPLDVALKRWVPTRIYTPGTMPAYSNYGASLAGYIVSRTSGERFDIYVRRHILTPTGMSRSSFTQPLPSALATDLSKAYSVASENPKPFEMISLSPAGGLSATGADMGRFMIAQLDNGGLLLNPSTATLMHGAANTPIPGLPSMALGFYHEDRNGLNIVGHAGDTNWFHSDLHLYLDKKVGLFVSFNSAGKNGAAHNVREALFNNFTNRYFPQKPTPIVASETAQVHGAAMVGHYISSRGSFSNWLKLVGVISEANVTQNSDSTITASAILNVGGVAKRWQEVAPWQWHEVNGNGRLNALVKDGRVAAFSIAEFSPIILFLPAPSTMNAGWIIPLLVAALAVMAFTASAWPVRALARRNYKYSAGTTGRPLFLQRATQITAWIMLLITGGWAAIISALSLDVTAVDGRLDIWMRLLQLLSLVGFIGAGLSIWHAVIVARNAQRGWLVKLWANLVALSAMYLIWLIISMNLVTPTLNY